MKRSPASEQISQGIIGLCFLLPLAFFPGLISLYRLPKLALLAFLTAVLCWLWAGAEIGRRNRSAFAPPLFLPLACYVLIGALSLFGSTNPYEGSIFLFQATLGIALFWLTCGYFDIGKLQRLFLWSALSAGIVSALGIVQAWGAEIPGLIAVSGPGATFGNKNMAAQYLLFALPAVFWLLLSATEARRE